MKVEDGEGGKQHFTNQTFYLGTNKGKISSFLIITRQRETYFKRISPYYIFLGINVCEL